MPITKLGFRPREVTLHGKKRWRIAYDYVTNGNGKKTAKYHTYKSKEEALDKQTELLRIQSQGDELAREAFQISNNFSVADCAQELAKVGATIKEATDYFLQNRFAKKGDVTALVAANDFLNHKKAEGIEESSFGNYRERVKKFTKHFKDQPIATINKAGLEKYFQEVCKYSNNNTERQHKKWIISMFNWFVDQDYISLPYGAKTEAQKLVVPNREPKTPKLATWQSVYDLLYWLDQRGKQVGGRNKCQTYDTLFYFCCCMFLGIRMKEAYAITWDDILWDTKELIILCENAKVDKRRVNEMPDNFWAWLKYLRGKAVLNPEGDTARRCARIVKHYREHLIKLGKKIPDLIAVKESLNPKAKLQEKYHNIKRHTFCGNHLRLHKNATKTATLMGNSTRQVEETYKELQKHKQDAVMFFNIKPPVALDDEEFQNSFNDENVVTIEVAVEACLSHERVKNLVGDYGDKYVDKDLTDSLKHYEQLIIRFLTVKFLDDEGKEVSYMSDEKEDELAKALDWETSPVRVGRGIKKLTMFDRDEDADRENVLKIYESLGGIADDEKVRQHEAKLQERAINNRHCHT